MKKIKLFTMSSLITLTIACGDNTGTDTDDARKDSATNTATASATDTSPNNLTSEDLTAGWKLLFDGNSLNGWRMYQNKKSDSWSVRMGRCIVKVASRIRVILELIS